MKDEHAAVKRIRGTEPAAEEQATPEQVLEFLAQHPDFLLQNEQILCELELPHRAGAAVSLVERQVSLLRERNIDSRQRLNRLVETARDNDLLFGRTRRLILALLEARTLAEVSLAVVDTLRREFGVEQASLLLQDGGTRRWPADAPRLGAEAAATTLRGLLLSGKTMTGPLRPQERVALFGEAAAEVQSAAIVPIGGEPLLAVLAAGSADPRRFHAEMGTLFLDFIGEVLARLLPRFAEPG